MDGNRIDSETREVALYGIEQELVRLMCARTGANEKTITNTLDLWLRVLVMVPHDA